jgi:ssDNA-binding Zn-finger/Zn-ribbon topoisomerase 1
LSLKRRTVGDRVVVVICSRCGQPNVLRNVTQTKCIACDQVVKEQEIREPVFGDYDDGPSEPEDDEWEGDWCG